MNDAITNWIEQAWSALDSIPGTSDAVAQERLRWEEFRGLDTLEVVVFGAYDAGKSSLLKRLLVDWRIPVPEWLTVSGRRETFESKRAEANGLGLVDTPGLGGGNKEHDDLTLSAMRLADAYLWVLPPQLVTAEKERFLDILFGDVGIAEATIAIVARMDEAGVDPCDNEPGFAELCVKKKEELTSLVAAFSSAKKLNSIHCVVADPYQMVGNMPNPEPEIYDIGRSWDGVENLAREILALRERRRDLRQQAGARFVRLLLGDVRDNLRQLADDLTQSREGMDNELNRHAIHEQRLDALQRQARAELHQQIENVLLSVSRSGNVGADSIWSLEEGLASAIDEWAEGSFAEYRRLASELELEARDRMAGPSMAGFRRLVYEAEEREGKQKGPMVDPLNTGRKVLAFGPTLRNTIEKYAAAELGMTLKVAAERLQKLESSGETVEAFIKSQGRRATFGGAEHAKKASHFVKWARIMDGLGPLVEQGGGLFLDMADDVMTKKQEDEHRQQRLELHRQLRTEGEKLGDDAAANFASTCNGLRHWLSERLSAISSSRESLSEQLKQIDKSVASIEELLAACP